MAENKIARRDGFRTKMGFIIACVGSAVGMGNIWLFPYRVGQYGGAAYLIPYFIFVALLGFCGVAGEMAFGRAMGTGPLGAFSQAVQMRNKKGGAVGKAIGVIPVIGSLGIAIGYSVVVGWFLRFLWGSITGEMLAAEDTAAYFGEVAGSFGSVGWHMLGLVITFAVMLLGVSKGIEKMNKWMMPLFFVLFLVLMVRVMTLGGNTVEGYRYLFVPRWEYLANPKTWVYALGQAFFSLSLAGSGTLVYGSYLSKDVDVVDSAKKVAFFDTCAALLSGLVVIPAVFAFGMDVTSGPPLMFITLPGVFQKMPLGRLFAVIFFIAALFAAITSLVNLFETPIEAIQQQFKLSRPVSVAIVALVAAVVGIFIENGDTVSTWMDVVSIYIIPLGALLAAVMFFWVCPKGFARKQVETGRKKPLGKWFEPLGKYVFVGVTLAVYILGIVYQGIG